MTGVIAISSHLFFSPWNFELLQFCDKNYSFSLDFILLQFIQINLNTNYISKYIVMIAHCFDFANKT